MEMEDLYEVLRLPGGGEACIGVTPRSAIKMARAKNTEGWKTNRYDSIAGVVEWKNRWASTVLSDDDLRPKYDARLAETIRIRGLIAQVKTVKAEGQIADGTKEAAVAPRVARKRKGKEWEGLWEDLYKVLGLQGGCGEWASVATADQVDRAYRTSKAFLQKTGAGEKYGELVAALKLERVEWAFDVLGKAEFRKLYDECFKHLVKKVKTIAFWKELKASKRAYKRMWMEGEMEDEEVARKRVRAEVEEARNKRLRREQQAADLDCLVSSHMKM